MHVVSRVLPYIRESYWVPGRAGRVQLIWAWKYLIMCPRVMNDATGIVIIH